MLKSARGIMAAQANLVQHLSSQNVVRTKSRSRLFLAIIALSVLAHGVVLGLPWPETQLSQEPPAPPPASDPETVVDVAILPTEVLKPPLEEAVESPAETSAATESETQVVERSPESSPPPLNAPPPTSQPLESPPPPPQQESEPTTPIPNPADELPPEPGSPNRTPSSPPTLQERLQDLGEYQYDSAQHFDDLNQDLLAIYQDWSNEAEMSRIDEPLQLSYELSETCLDNPPLRGLLMVVVDEVGNFRRGPEVVNSTGYALLDEQAENFVRTGEYRLPEGSEPKAYAVNIEVLYPAECP